jgi:hypothetical protein
MLWGVINRNLIPPAMAFLRGLFFGSSRTPAPKVTQSYLQLLSGAFSNSSHYESRMGQSRIMVRRSRYPSSSESGLQLERNRGR